MFNTVDMFTNDGRASKVIMLIFNQPITYRLEVLYFSIVPVIKIMFDGMESCKSKFVLYVETVLQKHVNLGSCALQCLILITG